MQPRSPESVSPEAVEAFSLFLARVAGGEELDFGEYCALHPGLEGELRTLKDRVNGFAGTLKGDSVTARIRESYGAGVDPGITLVAAEVSAGPDQSTDRLLHSRRYRLEGEVARGGQGAILRVWDEDLRRHLAMKVVLSSSRDERGRPSVDARVMKRFLEEAQVTGQLDHPGIVPVHELGFDDSGEVYFTMKLVRGEDLLSIFRKVEAGEGGWTRTRALGVMLKVCEAMAYAHHNNVIHRDLKPENVMVGTFGAVYVMDWGLARVSGSEDDHDIRLQVGGAPDVPAGASGSPLVTMDGDIVGTPAYMSPEQARGDLKAMGPHSDVYAMGAMLYRLLTGQTPYVPPGSGVDNVFVWKSVMAGPPIAVHQLASDVPAELESICEKAMARAPGERYANMSELAEDLQAFMENRVVAAHQTGAVHEFKKWVQRNKGLASACAAALLVLVVGLAVSLVLRSRAVRAETLAREEAGRANQEAVRANQEAGRANQEAERANQEKERASQEAERASQAAETSQQISAFMVGLFEVVDPGEARGNTITAREILDRGAKRIDAELADQPEVQSTLMETMGVVYKNLGLYDPAARLFERALTQREEVYGSEHPLVGESMNDLGVVLRFKANYEEAIPLLRSALEVRRRELGDEHPDVAESLHELAFALTEAGEYAEGERLFREALAIRRKVLGRHPAVAETLNELAFNLFYAGDEDSPRALLLEALELRRELLGVHPDVAESMNNLAIYLYQTGDPEQAEQLMRDALEMKRELLGDVHPEVAMSLNNLAFVLHDKREYERAEEMYREALAINIELLGEVHPSVAQAKNNLAFVLSDEGEDEEAGELLLSALAIYRAVHGGDDHPDVQGALETVTIFTRRLMMKLAGTVGTSHPDYAEARSQLGDLLAQAGAYEEAAGHLLAAYEALHDHFGPEAPATQTAVARLVSLYERWGRPDEAEHYRGLLRPAENR